MSLASDFHLLVNSVLLQTKISKYGTRIEGLLTDSRVTPTLTTVITGHSPGFLMASIFSRSVTKVILSFDLGTPPPGNRLVILGPAMTMTSIISFSTQLALHARANAHLLRGTQKTRVFTDGNIALYKSSKDLLGVCGFTPSSSTFSYALSGTDPWPAPQYGERAPPEASSKGCSRSIPIFW